MKNGLLFLATLFLLSIIVSCSSRNSLGSSKLIQKRKYNSGYYVNIKGHKSNNAKGIKRQDKTLPAQQKVNAKNDEIIVSNELAKADKNVFSSINENDLELIEDQSLLEKETQIFIEKECDEVILKNGDSFMAKVIEIGVREIKYKKCNVESGPNYSIAKSSVFMIKYANGEKDVFAEENNDYSNSSYDKSGLVKEEPLGVASLIIGSLGFVVALLLSVYLGLILSVIGGIFAVISLNKINKNPAKYKGKGLANAGLIVSIITALLSLIFIAILL